jgi:hypothetical protein
MSAERSTPVGVPHPQGIGEEPLLHFTKVYLTFLQGLFKQFPSGSYRWSESDADTEIMITDQGPVPRDRIEQRPAIVTMRGPAQFANMTLDQLKGVDWRTGAREHTDLISCTMTLNCIAKSGVEAQRIAWIVMRHIRIFKRLLQQQGHMHKIGDELQIGPETPPGSLVAPEPDAEMVNVSVFSPFFFQWNEKVTLVDAPPVEELQMHMQAALHPDPGEQELTANRQQTLYKRPSIRGVPVVGTSVPISNPLTAKIKT